MVELTVVVTVEPEVQFATPVNVEDDTNSNFGPEPDLPSDALEGFPSSSEESVGLEFDASSHNTDEPESVNNDVSEDNDLETVDSIRNRARYFLNEINLSPPTSTTGNSEENLEDVTSTSPSCSDESNPNLQSLQENAAEPEENQTQEESEIRNPTCRGLLLVGCRPQCASSSALVFPKKTFCCLIIAAIALIIYGVYRLTNDEGIEGSTQE